MNAAGRWLRRGVPSAHTVDAAGLGACVLVLGLAYVVGLAPRSRHTHDTPRRAPG